MRAPANKIDWTPERLNTMRKMANLGHTSYEISRKLGLSRSAICGKCWRLGIKLRGKPLNGVNKSLELKA